MIAFLLHPANLPFTVALGVMLVLGAMEIIGFAMGVGVSNVLDSVLPDFGDADVDADVDIDADADLAHAGMPTDGAKMVLRPLSWLGLGKVPVLILPLILLTTFGVLGLAMQYGLMAVSGGKLWLPAWIAWLPVLIAAMPMVRWSAGVFSRVMPKDTTSAISTQTFIERIAVVTTGTARRGQPAEAKFRDEFGQTHYLMVEPEDDNEALESGTSIVLTGKTNGKFRAVRNTHELPKIP